jgi:methylmalonyl-CoA/ethylmalonyl-CoA epimerase
VQREFLEKRGEGVNHLGFVVEDLEGAVSRLTERGFRVVSRGRVAHGGAFAYFDTDRVGGIIFELIKLPESGEDGETRSAVADAGDRP